MADKTTMEAKVSIKVFVDKVKQRVVYAEADHTFVDILFSFMAMPLGTIVRLLGKLEDKRFEALGSLNNLYQSLVDFPEYYFATEECKDLLLNPRSVAHDHCTKLKLEIDSKVPMTYFICGRCTSVDFSVCNKAKCRKCGCFMTYSCTSDLNVSAAGDGVFVSNIATFIITDDFSVIPYTAEDCFRLLSDSGITDMSHLDERTFDMNREQILYLVKMALSVDSPFTHFVFPTSRVLNTRSGATFHQCDFKKKEASKASKMFVEVYLQKSTGKLLFAEAKNDFVDFAFGFLSIPMGTVIGTLMDGVSSITCMDNLFRSISNMNVGRCLKTQSMKDMLVKPHFGQEYVSINQVFSLKDNNSSRTLASYDRYPKDPRAEGTFVRQSGMFIVTDDMVITPSSSHLAMKTLSKLKVPFDDVEKCEISIGVEEALRMLKMALVCKSTMTNCLQHLLRK